MGRKGRAQGFFTPFADIKLAPAKANQAPAPNKLGASRARAKPPVRAAQRDEPVLGDAQLFLQAMADCELHEQKVERELKPQRKDTRDLRPTEDEEALAELTALVRGEGAFRIHEGEEMHTGLAPGVNHQLLDQLMAGQFAYFHCLDLHGLVRDQAHAALVDFIGRSRCELGASCVLIVTGRGRGSPLGQSVLREALPRWLSRHPIRPHVLAFCTARAVDGGPGAFYVLLRRQGVRPFAKPTLCP